MLELSRVQKSRSAYPVIPKRITEEQLTVIGYLQATPVPVKPVGSLGSVTGGIPLTCKRAGKAARP